MLPSAVHLTGKMNCSLINYAEEAFIQYLVENAAFLHWLNVRLLMESPSAFTLKRIFWHIQTPWSVKECFSWHPHFKSVQIPLVRRKFESCCQPPQQSCCFWNSTPATGSYWRLTVCALRRSSSLTLLYYLFLSVEGCDNATCNICSS